MFHSWHDKPWLLYAILGCSLSLNLVMVLQRSPPVEPVASTAPLVEPVPEPQDVQPSPVKAEARPMPKAQAVEANALGADSPFLSAQGALVMSGEEASSTPLPAHNPNSSSQWSVVTADVEHSLSRTFQKAVEEDGEALSAVYARLFMWDLDLRRDLQRGDGVAVVYRPAEEGKFKIGAASFASVKLGRTIEAYRWRRPGDSFPSYWTADGEEVPRRLKNSPLATYDQITALLRDRPDHRGIDFKAPEGTPVISPRAGTVTRVNWNTRANGNCLEVRYSDGVVAKFLHLSETQVRVGQNVRAGEALALTGNTGRSTAPHLHYELARDGRVLDPLDYHGTIRRQLEGESLEALQQEVERLASLLSSAVASG